MGSLWSENSSSLLAQDDELTSKGLISDCQPAFRLRKVFRPDWQPVSVVTMTGGSSVKVWATETVDQVKEQPHKAKLEASVSGIGLI